MSLAAAATVALLAGGCLSAAGHHRQPTPGASLTGSSKVSHGHHRSSGPATALRVVSITPASGAKGVGFSSPVTVRFSTALSASSPTPKIRPAVPGAWAQVGTRELVFRPAGSFVPYAKETVTVPAGRAGPASSRGAHLVSASTATFTVAGGSVLRLQQLLAELGYLPVSFRPQAGGASHTAPVLPAAEPSAPSPGTGALGAAPSTRLTRVWEPAVPSQISRLPVPGMFYWRFTHVPRSLLALWSPGTANVITDGAVMQFEMDHGLGSDGVAGPQVWAALIRAVAHRDVTSAAYDYVEVATSNPEYLTLWRNGVVVFTTLVNTGIPQAPTQVGTWPVFVRYIVTTMSGTNPDGSHYSDPGIPWTSYFHGGDALHGFIRAQYGYPQSLGCVEMPFASAKVVYPFTPLGTLVTVL